MKLSLETEEVATFYGRMLDHDYTTKDVFNKNFFKDWRKVGINRIGGCHGRVCIVVGFTTTCVISAYHH